MGKMRACVRVCVLAAVLCLDKDVRACVCVGSPWEASITLSLLVIRESFSILSKIC